MGKVPMFDAVTLSTVDRFQGDEADIVIISLVRHFMNAVEIVE
jgi:superfamily I DNA and/or RNA helicase